MASKDQHIAVDPNADNSDSSDYASGSEYSTASLTSSIYGYRYENGRRYHAYKDGAYVLPNDEKEQDRLDIIHHAYTLMNEGKVHLAPIGENPQKILDIGTGTGIWAIDVAERYPSAEVIGTDLSPIQPSWVPPNVQFQIDDAESTWTWKEDTFDLIHIRHLSGAISDWKRLIRQAYRCAKPGGYIEIAEYDLQLYSDDGTLHKDMYLSKFYDLINEAGRKNGRKFDGLEKTKNLIEDAGFENIYYRVVKLPVGIWPADPKEKEIGAYLLLNAETAFDAYGMALFTRELGMSQEEAKRVVVGAEKDIKNRKIHSYSRHHLFYGRKPLRES